MSTLEFFSAIFGQALLRVRARFMVFNATFNNISPTSWGSVLLMEEIRVPRVGFELTTLVMIGTDCIVSYISNHHTIMTTTAPTSTVKVRSFFCITKFPTYLPFFQ